MVISNKMVSDEFYHLLKLWKNRKASFNTGYMVSMVSIRNRLIELGIGVVPSILVEFRDNWQGIYYDNPYFWFIILENIVNEYVPGTNANYLREAWLEWGRQHGYI